MVSSSWSICLSFAWLSSPIARHGRSLLLILLVLALEQKSGLGKTFGYVKFFEDAACQYQIMHGLMYLNFLDYSWALPSHLFGSCFLSFPMCTFMPAPNSLLAVRAACVALVREEHKQNPLLHPLLLDPPLPQWCHCPREPTLLWGAAEPPHCCSWLLPPAELLLTLLSLMFLKWCMVWGCQSKGWKSDDLPCIFWAGTQAAEAPVPPQGSPLLSLHPCKLFILWGRH